MDGTTSTTISVTRKIERPVGTNFAINTPNSAPVVSHSGVASAEVRRHWIDGLGLSLRAQERS